MAESTITAQNFSEKDWPTKLNDTLDNDNHTFSFVAGQKKVSFNRNILCFLSPMINNLVKERVKGGCCCQASHHIYVSLAEEKFAKSLHFLKTFLECGIVQQISSSEEENLKSLLKMLDLNISYETKAAILPKQEIKDEASSFKVEIKPEGVKFEPEDSEYIEPEDEVESKANIVVQCDEGDNEDGLMNESSKSIPEHTRKSQNKTRKRSMILRSQDIHRDNDQSSAEEEDDSSDLRSSSSKKILKTGNQSENKIRRNNMFTKQFLCQVCNKSFTSRSHLQRHSESIHEGVRYFCNYCDYEATQKNNLNIHVKLAHKKEEYSCERCCYKAGRKRCVQCANRHLRSSNSQVSGDHGK